MTCGERNLSAHIFLRARIILNKTEKMNLENNYFRKIKIFEKCFFPSYRKSISTVNELQAKGVLNKTCAQWSYIYVQKQNKGPSQHLLNGSGKLDKNLIEMGVIDPEAEVHYLLQAY